MLILKALFISIQFNPLDSILTGHVQKTHKRSRPMYLASNVCWLILIKIKTDQEPAEYTKCQWDKASCLLSAFYDACSLLFTLLLSLIIQRTAVAA